MRGSRLQLRKLLHLKYELVRTKQLPAVCVGRHVRMKASEVERFIASHDSIKRLDNVVSQRLDRPTKPMG